jgi:hypothetical protein
LGGYAADATTRLARLVATYWSVHHRSRAARALHVELSRLSDAELARRGLTRSDMNKLVFENLTAAQDAFHHAATAPGEDKSRGSSATRQTGSIAPRLRTPGIR